MLNLNDICLNIIEDNKQLTTAGIVDQESALLLGFASDSEDVPLDYFETLAAAIVNMYCGRTINTVESLISAIRGRTTAKSVSNIHLVMNNSNIFASAVSGVPALFLFVITKEESDIDDIWNIVNNNTEIISAVGL